MLLSENQFRQVSLAVDGLTPAQLAWVGGYFTGLSQSTLAVDLATSSNTLPEQAAANTSPETAPQAAIKTTILFGTQTGNSKKLAEKLHAQLTAQGGQAEVLNIKKYRPQNLKKEQRLIVVISTHGNGEPPDEARVFFKFINGNRAPKLDHLEYSILALGDSSYEEFCQAGSDLDKRFAELGAKSFVTRVDCDLDFDEASQAWQEQVIQSSIASNNVIPLPTAAAAEVKQAVYSASNPFQAEVIALTPVTAAESDKEVWHFEFSLEDSGITYQAGDILAVQVNNPDSLVDEVIQLAGFDAQASVQVKGAELLLKQALKEKLELTTLTSKQLKAYAEQIANKELQSKAEDKAAIVDWLYGRDWVDVIKAYQGEITAQAFVELLRPLKAREYSIASSLTAHEDEVHLLVKRVEFEKHERKHLGAGSNYLANLQEGDTVGIHVKENPSFKLPQNDDTKIIMIGAGTGVAPFRSFMAEREAKGLAGNSWLFFGEQHFRTDFLYQTEWQSLLADGVLERISLAFSRDQAEKIYVQHRLLEEAQAVYQWIQAGAHIYVCGDMHHMAKDVNQALLQIISSQAGVSEEEAQTRLEQLIDEGRYQRDVY